MPSIDISLNAYRLMMTAKAMAEIYDTNRQKIGRASCRERV